MTFTVTNSSDANIGTAGSASASITGTDASSFRIVTNSKLPITKLEDFSGAVECVMWPDDYLRFKELVVEDQVWWLDRGAAGWRLDAAYAVPDRFWAQVLPRVRSAFLAEAQHAGRSVTGMSPADRQRKQVWTAGRRVLEHEFGKVMRWADPTIKLIAHGVSHWDAKDFVERGQILLEQAADQIDYLAVHWYVDNDRDALEIVPARRVLPALKRMLARGFGRDPMVDVIGVSLRTAQRDWMKARAWLQEELRA